MNDNDGAGRELKVLKRGFEIIELISHTPGLTLTDISEELAVPKSTAHIYLQTLEQSGYIVNTDDGYDISFKFLTIGGLRRNRFHLYEVAREPMAELSDDLDDVFNVALATEERGQRVLIYKIEGEKSPFADVPVGHMTNLHWVAHGKALLSNISDERIDRIVDRHGLPKATQHTITSRDELHEELETIRDQGYSLEDEERVEGIRAIAVPVEGTEQDPLGSISISGPKSRLDADHIPEFVDRLKKTTNIVEIEYQNY
ncbi:IclR family transcriptional regulator [Haloarcula nitratireducens]|uniref:IclR family transcriptional regulator n=1 Tax=Haloarcula nitratireducens TaxID=2487749 RepID=A0AAW4PGE7_9EURY|nr:IclR family transcriptional regulator [Halomicroarcula nitratireducens]MBX0296963.1 IclR family transcriptional regulator [Halomicroarcula nitratireducens]